MKSTITIAASSVCKHQICQITDRLKIQLRTVGCSIFYFCRKQTMNVFFHCTFTRICVDFSCKTAFISYLVMTAKTRVLKCCCLLFAWTEFWESVGLCCADGKMQICYPTCSRTLPRTKEGAATHMLQICKQMLRFNFILGLNFIFFCLKLIIIHYHTQKQKKIKFKPRIKLNHNINTKSIDTKLQGPKLTF